MCSRLVFSAVGGVGVGGVDLRGRLRWSSARRVFFLLLRAPPPPPMLFSLLMMLLSPPLFGSRAIAVVGGVPLNGRLPATTDGATPPDSFGGCVYGGSEYAEGQAVVTDEQCLNCTCSRGALVCHLRACPPLPKVPGCSAVRKAGHACCPSIVCADEVNNTIGRAIEEMSFGAETAKSASGCDVEGREFEEGSNVPGIAGRCEECRCRGGKVECARAPCSPAPPGCTALLLGGRGGVEECCRYDCPPTLALLIDIDLGSNIESVLAPPSHEELMSYFGSNSTEVSQDEEKGTATVGSGHSLTTSTEGVVADAQSAVRVLGDSRKDRHMETSTNEQTAVETSTLEDGGKGSAEGNSTDDDGKKQPPGGSAGRVEVVKVANGSEEEKMVMEGKGGGADTGGSGETSTEVLVKAGATTTEESPGEDTEGVAETTTTTLDEQVTDSATPPLDIAEDGTEYPREESETATDGGEAEEEESGATEAVDPTTTTTEASVEGASSLDYGDNETTAYSATDEGNATATAGEEAEEPEVETEYPGGPFSDNYSLGNETADDSDYDQLQNVTGDDNSTAVDAAFMDSSKNVSNVLGSGEEEADGVVSVEEAAEGSSNETGGAAVSVEEKTMDKMILAEKGSEGNATEEAAALPSPLNCTEGTTEVDHVTTTVVGIERKKDMDYEEYDYGEPTLPPSLPNLRIIPFVAADAVLDKDKHKTTEAPIFFDGVPPSLFSPPVETEGGFVPREPPILDGGLHDVTYKSPILSDNLPSFQTDIPLTGIAAIELTTTSKPNVQGDFGLQSLVVNGTLGSSVLDSLFSPLDQLPPEKGIHALLSPIIRPSFLDSKIVPLKPMPGTLTFYNNASHYPPPPTAVPSSPSKSQTVPVTYSPLPTKIPNYNTFPSSSHKGTAASPFSAVRNTAKRPSTMGVTPATTTNENNIILAMMTSSPSGASPSGGQRRPLPSSDRVSVIPLGPTPPRPSPSTSAPYSVGPNLPPSMKPLTSPPVTSASLSMASSSPVQQNPPAVGLLKLAGCNIYGRMYRVGRIISELSGPCLECRCTEVGVQCRPLPC